MMRSTASAACTVIGRWSGMREIAHLHGITLPFGDEDRALIQIRRHRLRIERGGHHHHDQIRPLRLLQMLHQRERDIAEQVPLVELIEDHRPDIGQRAIILQPAQQDALRDKTNARADARVIIEPNLIANLRAQLAARAPRPRAWPPCGPPRAGVAAPRSSCPPAIPASSSICGTCVVLPEPVGATSTRRLPPRSVRRMSAWIFQMGSAVEAGMKLGHHARTPGRKCE